MAAVTGAAEPSNTDLDETRVEPSGQTNPGDGRSGPSLAPGSMVSRYRIVDELGAGGMGEVFSALDPELDRRIALKLVKLSQREKAEHARNRLLREAQALAKLSHPNVVAVYDVGTHADRVFIAMEHLEGRTMADWIEEASAHPPGARWREGLALMLQAGRGLAAAHAEGLVHRDFKPANIMVSADGRVRVLDFGLARRFGEQGDSEDSGPFSGGAVGPDSLEQSGPFASGPHGSRSQLSSRSSLRMQLTQAGMVMGTPAYMAPEQFFGGRIDARTDQFAFCIVLWRVLFGQRPFEGDSFQELGRAVSRGELREPPKLPGLPRVIRLALQRGLSVSRDARHPTMDALLDELERAVAQRRRRRVWATAGGLLLLGGVGGALALSAADAEAPCRGAEAKLAGVWDDAVRARMTEAFARSDVPYAEDARASATRALDDYATRWVELHTETCEATRVRGDQSEALMDLRIGCLDGKLRDVAAQTALLAEADVDVIKNAAQATQALPRPEDCVALERDAAALFQPDDPAIATTVETVREQVAKARALGYAGKYDAGLVEVEAAAATARATGYKPVIAEATSLLGELQERKLAGTPARAGYEEALYAAMASGHALHEALALIGLISVWGMHLSDTETALRYGLQAEAVVERLGQPPQLRAAIALYRGNTLMAANRFEAALVELGRAVEISEGVAIAERIHLAALNNLAAVHGQQGHYREAAEAFKRVLELTEQRLGAWHPTVGTNHNNLGVTYSRLEDYELATQHTERALEIYGKTLGPDHPEVGRSYHNMGVIQSSTGRLQEALDSYKKALELKIAGMGPDHPSVALTANNVGDVLVRLGRAKEAIAYFEDALRIWAKQGPDNPSSMYGLISLAEAHLALEDPKQAEPYIRRALALAEVGEMDPIEIAKARFVAAKVVWAAGGSRKESLALAEAARRGYEASERPSVKEIAAIDEWLAGKRR